MGVLLNGISQLVGLPGAGLLSGRRIQNNVHRPVGLACHVHLRAEHTCLDDDAPVFDGGQEYLVQRLGLLGLSGGDERWPAPPPAIAHQREIRDGQDAPRSIPDGQVQLALSVVKYSKVRNLFAQPLRVRFIVIRGHANVDQQAALNSRNDLLLYFDLSPIDPLDYCSH